MNHLLAPWYVCLSPDLALQRKLTFEKCQVVVLVVDDLGLCQIEARDSRPPQRALPAS